MTNPLLHLSRCGLLLLALASPGWTVNSVDQIHAERLGRIDPRHEPPAAQVRGAPYPTGLPRERTARAARSGRAPLAACAGLDDGDRSALMAALPGADYYCTEAIAAALAAFADSALITDLLAEGTTHPNGDARRNAFRVLGCFAERGAGDPAYAWVVVTRGADVQAALLNRLQNDTDDNVLQDVLWIADAFFYPMDAIQPFAQSIALNATMSSSLRFRAATVIQRLFYPRVSLANADIQYIVAALATDDDWVRAEAAFTAELMQDSQLSASQRTDTVTALQSALATENVIIPKAYMARALDRFEGGTAHYTAVRGAYEAAHLPQTYTLAPVTIRSGLDASALPTLADGLNRERLAFFNWLGSGFAAPVAGDVHASVTVIIFATIEEYQEYMNAFVGSGVNAGGLYLENDATLYTFERTPFQSSYTLEELLHHEFAHYLQGRYVYPGQWGDAGYHTEPKGWADEGFAEFMAGLVVNNDGSSSAPWRESYTTLCSQPVGSLSALITRREGYDQAGVFDYERAWSFVYYLMRHRAAAGRALYAAYRDQTYSVAGFAGITGMSVGAMETDWEAAKTSDCLTTPSPSDPSPVAALGQVFVYPNPVRGESAVFFAEIAAAEKVHLRIYDLAGKLVHETSAFQGPVTVNGLSGYRYTWSAHDVAYGAYYYTLETTQAGHTEQALRKFAVIR